MKLNVKFGRKYKKKKDREPTNNPFSVWLMYTVVSVFQLVMNQNRHNYTLKEVEMVQVKWKWSQRRWLTNWDYIQSVAKNQHDQPRALQGGRQHECPDFTDGFFICCCARWDDLHRLVILLLRNEDKGGLLLSVTLAWSWFFCGIRLIADSALVTFKPVSTEVSLSWSSARNSWESLFFFTWGEGTEPGVLPPLGLPLPSAFNIWIKELNKDDSTKKWCFSYDITTSTK